MNLGHMNIKKSNIFVIDEGFSGQRLDNFLIKQIKGIPKSLIYKLIRGGQVRVNSGRSKVSYRILKGDLIRIPPNLLKDQAISEKILVDTDKYTEYENDNFILINKPYGIAVHAGTNQRVDFISSLKKAHKNENITLVHRLDKDTSGCLIVSKNYKTSAYFGKLFANREITKKYYALLVGRLQKNVIEIESSISKKIVDKKMVINESKGKDAYTKIKVIEKFKFYTYVEIEIETGRTHQIRAHTASIGHPVAGDRKYSKDNSRNMNKSINLNRLFLHSFYISFFFEKQYEFILDLPSELKEVLSNLEIRNE